MSTPVTNLLTVDVEEWYHPNLAASRPSGDDVDVSHLETNVGRLLELFARRGVRATFFVVGRLAERKPEILRMIRRDGHAVALHGWDHELLYRQSRAEFESDVDRSLDAVATVIGVRPRGFRAPSWSMTPDTTWAWEVLESRGLEYDSSIFPVRTFLFGIAGAPRFPHRPRVNGRALTLLEIPASTVEVLGYRVPFSGGSFLRALPRVALEAAIRRLNAEGAPAVVYCHPWEIDPSERRPTLPWHHRIIHSVGMAGCFGKLDAVLRSFAFASIEDMLDVGALGVRGQ